MTHFSILIERTQKLNTAKVCTFGTRSREMSAYRVCSTPIPDLVKSNEKHGVGYPAHVEGPHYLEGYSHLDSQCGQYYYMHLATSSTQ
jgi:hypothetical protein